MKSIIEELYYGNACSETDFKSRSDEAQELAHYILTHHENLYSTLTNEQIEIFEKFIDCSNELNEMNERKIFTDAFRLGARIAIEVLMPMTDSLNIC